jgi:hypothetical protein
MMPPRSALLAASLVVACSTPTPDGMTLEIIPAEPSTFDGLTAIIPEQALGEGVTYAYTWSQNGSVVSDLTGAYVPAERTARGDVWSVVATPTSENGKKVGATATSEVTIRNTPPIANRVALDDDKPTSSDVLTATATGSDIDEDALTWTFTWYVNGEEVQSGASDELAIGNYIDGDLVDVSAIATDGEDESTLVRSTPVRIRNSPPQVLSVEIASDADPHGFTDLTCAPTETFDQDGDALTFDYEWTVNGERVGPRDEIVNRIGRRGDVVTCRARGFDGKQRGEWTESAAITLSNTPPAAPELAITPTDTTDADSPVCAVLSGVTDWDGDALTFAFDWTLDGSAWTGPTRRTVHAGDTIDNAYIEVDQEWSCAATATDGSLTSDAGSSPSVVIRVNWLGPREFNNCGKVGTTGPSASECATAYKGKTLDGEVSVTAGRQSWVVPVTGRYTIEAQGARGNGTGSTAGGSGAIIKGEFELIAGDTVFVSVGQQGTGGSYQGGGGGGTWVYKGTTPLLIAGGGGGMGYYGTSWGYTSCAGSTTEYGGQPAYGSWGSCGGTKSTDLRQGGRSGCYYGGGGAGIDSNGANDSCYGSGGGLSWSNGLTGGTGSGSGNGGFGGGGSGGGDWGAGAGGGYSGGNGASSDGVGGGGGSYNSGTNKTARTGNTGHGKVVLDLILD